MIGKEFTLEWRHKYALGGVLLYLVSMVFVAYLAFDGLIPVQTWNALFWLIMLFAAMNAILKSFVQEAESRQLYYYTLMAATDFMAAKILYNTLLMMGLGVAGLLIFVAFMGNPMAAPGLFLGNLLLGMLGFAAVLSLISAIASRAKNNFTLMAVLGFPLVLPLLLLLIRVSRAGIQGPPFAGVSTDLLLVVLILVISLSLSMLLFPYIWRH